MYLGLPEPRPGFTARDVETIVNGVRELQGLPVNLAPVTPFPLGHAAGAKALAAAMEGLHNGPSEICLIGGADSYYNPITLEWLDANRQLAGADSRSGFVPGEAAGVCLLATEAYCTRQKWLPRARVLSVSLGQETKLIKTEDVCVGTGLTQTVEAAIAALRPGETIPEVICDLNGERYRGEEWGFVCLRLAQHFDAPTGYRSPADCWGDVGAASIPLFVMLACEAAQRGYSAGSRTLVWAGSEGGLRGVALLDAGANR